MTVSPTIRAALEASKYALGEIVAEAPEKEPMQAPGNSFREHEEWAFDSAAWDRAETARPALELVNAALAEMEAQL